MSLLLGVDRDVPILFIYRSVPILFIYLSVPILFSSSPFVEESISE